MVDVVDQDVVVAVDALQRDDRADDNRYQQHKCQDQDCKDRPLGHLPSGELCGNVRFAG